MNILPHDGRSISARGFTKLGLNGVVSNAPGPRVDNDWPLDAQLSLHMATKVLIVEVMEVGAGYVIVMVLEMDE